MADHPTGIKRGSHVTGAVQHPNFAGSYAVMSEPLGRGLRSPARRASASLGS